MDINKCRKFIQFLLGEIDRYVRSGSPSDSEMILFINELDNFKEKVADSKIPVAIKKSIHELSFNYSINKIERSYAYFLAAYLSLGTWAFILRARRKKRRIIALGGIRNELNKLLREIILG